MAPVSIQESLDSFASVEQKVLRRAEVSRLARLLQGRLALASYKAKNGLQTLPLGAIEPSIDEQLRIRKRRFSDATTSSSPMSVQRASFFSEADIDWVKQSPTPKGNRVPVGRQRSSSIRKGGVGHLDLHSSDSALLYSKQQQSLTRKRSRSEIEQDFLPPPSSKRRDFNYPASSPGYDYGRRRVTGHAERTPRNNPSSFRNINAMATLPIQEQAEPQSPIRQSAQPQAATVFRSSPPRTPPRRTKPSSTTQNGADGAELLLYLATSPSPATTKLSRTLKAPIITTTASLTDTIKSGSLSTNLGPPMTPPPRTPIANLPSSLMRTPVFQTPGAFLNFNDFIHDTPSPAQGPGRGTPTTPQSVQSPRVTFGNALTTGATPISRRVNAASTGGSRVLELGGELGAV